MIERGVTLDDKDTKKNAKTEVRHPNSGDTLKVTKNLNYVIIMLGYPQ